MDKNKPEKKTSSPLLEVYTSREAAELWGLSENTVTQWCNRGRFTTDEARKSGKVWIVTHDGMVRLTGKDINKPGGV
ncbi:helix-turn-helix domain-containing protein [Paenibacillus sp. MCAF20]